MCEAAFTASPVLQFLFLGGFPGMRLLCLRALVSQGSALRIFKTQERLQNALFELLETKELDQMLQSALAFCSCVIRLKRLFSFAKSSAGLSS